jgi:predicted phosphoribosyltransferase
MREIKMSFENRAEAAHLLAARLGLYRGQNPLVLAIPRGAVPMGKIIADALGGELDVVLVRKLRAPYNPELAIGSIDDAGVVYLDPDTRDLGSDAYLEAEKHVQSETLRQRREMYGLVRPRIDAAGRIAIVIDDGIATGSTMIAALRAVRTTHPERLIAATAVAPADTLRLIRPEADEVVCLETPAVFYAIGSHFRDFSQVSDEDVTAILKETARAPDTLAAAHAKKP